MGGVVWEQTRCPAYVHIPHEKRKKLYKKAWKGIFVGYADRHAGIYKIWDPENRVIKEARFVIFDELHTRKSYSELPKRAHKEFRSLRERGYVMDGKDGVPDDSDDGSSDEVEAVSTNSPTKSAATLSQNASQESQTEGVHENGGDQSDAGGDVPSSPTSHDYSTVGNRDDEGQDPGDVEAGPRSDDDIDSELSSLGNTPQPDDAPGPAPRMEKPISKTKQQTMDRLWRREVKTQAKVKERADRRKAEAEAGYRRGRSSKNIAQMVRLCAAPK